jgi:hypothetical protein
MDKLIHLTEVQKLRIENAFLKRETHTKIAKEHNDHLDKECKDAIRGEDKDFDGQWSLDLGAGTITLKSKDTIPPPPPPPPDDPD